MEKMIIGVLGVAFRMFLRYWARDSKILSANIVDAEQFAQQFGLTIWEAKKFNRSIDEFIDIIAEDFIKEFGSQMTDNERKDAILIQIQKDIKKICISESKLISEIFNPEDLRNLIMCQSEKERETWSDVEVGLYTNCVRYIAKVGMDFISKLPSFAPTALKIIIQRQDEYYNDLHNILMDIHSMTSLIKSVDTTYQEYESTYREKIIEKYSKVELIGAGLNNARSVTRYDISSAYVALSCANGDEYSDEIELSQVFTYNNVVWIKGEAGSGKTTFLQWVAVCAAKNEYQKIDNIRNTVPIVIELRNAVWPISLQDAVNKITVKYGSSCPDGWILDLLKKSRAILLFDGLDEISYAKRKETYDFIEDIIENYPQIKILLAARNSVKDCIDCESVDYEILPMKIENIKEFIVYWHRSVLRKDAIIKDEEIDRLQYNLKQRIVESQPLKALARNPLLCAMICALNYVNNEQLPEDKMELYEKCCEMLIDARDNQRNIDCSIYEKVPRLDYSKKRKILEEMAYWMMNGGVSSESKKNVIEFLGHLFKDTNILLDKKSEYSTETILNYLVERSGIIREPEEGNIDFIHKTFMEFLAVKAICRNCDWNVLVREACNVNWKETIVMCFREMGKDNVKHVLRKLMFEGNYRNDERYILIASLGASNAVFLADDKIKEEIDAKISDMIPPKYDDISEMAEAGTYLLPFLKDSEKYSDVEKERCLNLLERLLTEEAIPDILSYIGGNGNDYVKLYALDILSGYNELTLDEYNVREQLVNIMLNSIDGDTLTTYESMLNILDTEELTDRKLRILEKANQLVLICGVAEESMYIGKTEFLWYLKNCEKIILKGNVRRLNFLRQFVYVTDLTIKATGDLSDAVQIFLDFKNLANLKNLYIETKQLKYFCQNDLCNLRNIETFELHCKDYELELSFNDFNEFPKLKRVVLDINKYLVAETLSQVPIWKKNNDNLEIVVCSN